MLDIQNYIGKPKIVVDQESPKKATFQIQYLPRGFWYTFGNAIRRAILGYNAWGSITWLKIKWVPHEYESIDWLKDSALDIMLNFKKLRFKVDSNVEKMQWISQRFAWIWTYNSSSLKLPAWIELLNEDVHLFEITDPAVELIIDFRLEKWYGYYSLDFLRRREKSSQESDISLLLIDNDFKLVDYVTYDISEHIDDFTWSSKDELFVEIKTISDKVSPKEIISFVWEVLSSYSKMLVFDESYVDKSLLTEYSEMSEDDKQDSSEKDIKIKPIDAIPLSERTRNALIKNNILYVEELETKKKSELLSMKWVGRKAVDEIITSLQDIWKSLVW